MAPPPFNQDEAKRSCTAVLIRDLLLVSDIAISARLLVKIVMLVLNDLHRGYVVVPRSNASMSAGIKPIIPQQYFIRLPNFVAQTCDDRLFALSAPSRSNNTNILFLIL